MQWEKSASDTLEKLVSVVRDPFRQIIKSNAQTHAEKYAEIRKSPHVTGKEAVLGFLRARSHKLTGEGLMILEEYQLTEREFMNYPTTGTP
jgi:23S rRNA maturation mini-RNase III